jgi:hypothetical protein
LRILFSSAAVTSPHPHPASDLRLLVLAVDALRRPLPAPVSISLCSRLVAVVATKEPELGGGGRSEGGGGAGGSGGGGGGDSDSREGGLKGEWDAKEEKMGQGLSMSQKLTLAYAALVRGNAFPPEARVTHCNLQMTWIGCEACAFLCELGSVANH